MSACRYLTGENIAPRLNSEAKALIGKKVQYLMSSDIDHSGRGYIFPRSGTVAAVVRREIAMDHPENFCVDLGRLVEMTLVEEESTS